MACSATERRGAVPAQRLQSVCRLRKPSERFPRHRNRAHQIRIGLIVCGSTHHRVLACLCNFLPCRSIVNGLQ